MNSVTPREGFFSYIFGSPLKSAKNYGLANGWLIRSPFSGLNGISKPPPGGRRTLTHRFLSRGMGLPDGTMRQRQREISEDGDFRYLLGLKGPDKRMKDIELVLRLVVFFHSTYLNYKPPIRTRRS